MNSHFIQLLCFTVEEKASTQGIYRVSGLDEDIKSLKAAMDKRTPILCYY